MTNTIVLQAPVDVVVEQGVCYSEKEKPTIDDAHAVLFLSDGSFEDPLEYENGNKKALPAITSEYLATKEIYYSDPLAFEYQ